MSSRRLLSGADRNRARQSTAAASSSSARTTNRGARATAGPPELPDYEPPSFALDKDGRKALEELSTNRDSRVYAEHIQKSLHLLSDSVRDINDRYTERKAYVKARQEKRRGAGEGAAKTDPERAGEQAALALREIVPPLTDECELAVRNVIDLQIELEDGTNALKETLRTADEETAAQAAARQAAAAAAAQNGGVDDDDDDAVARGADQPEIVGPCRTFRQAKKRLADDYAVKTMYERYSINNDYIGFKRMAHDAIHGTDGKPLPDPSRWFTQDGRRAEEGDGDDEDDLIIAEESIDIHCPLSMVVMDNPYTSRKCKHTFNKSSLDEFFGRSREKKKCPQTGCGQQVRYLIPLSTARHLARPLPASRRNWLTDIMIQDLAMVDFYPDPVMLRRIKRAQAGDARVDVDYDDDDDQDEEAVAKAEDAGEGDTTLDLTQQANIKAEGGRDRGRRPIEAIEDD